MSLKILKIESSQTAFGLFGECKPHRENIGNLSVYEVYSYPESNNGDIGKYQVVIESEIHDHTQLEERNREAVSLAEEIEMLWPYVWTIPLHGKTRGIVLEFIKPPKGWATNKEDVRRELDIENGGLTFGSLSFIRNESRHSSQLPLERALRVRSKYQEAEPIIKTLIDFHFEALKSRSTHSSLFLLSKGLEITKAYLPGKTDKEKQRSLPTDAQKDLRNTYHALFGLANSRKNTRHAIKRNNHPLELHPELEGAELEDFIHDCDLIIRSVVCDYFNEEIVILKKREDNNVAT